MNFSVWSGWLVFEEFDLLLLGTLAGAYARLACLPVAGLDATLPPRSAPRYGIFISGLLVLMTASAVLALQRGFADAGGFQFDWFAGYRDALNSWRVFKSLGFALLFIPLLREQLNPPTSVASTLLAKGVVTGLTLVALATLWERAAFPGALDFSAHYRTVALFWEMHVGGAAIDAYLAMTTPFVVWALLATRRPGVWAGLAVVALLVGYACLTTFARGVYLAVGLPLILLALLLWLRKLKHDPQGAVKRLRIYGATWGWRVPAGLLLCAALLLEVVVVLMGGTFMTERLASAEKDMSSRLAHWQQGVDLLASPADWLLGKGLGRLPANYAAQGPQGEFSGDVRLGVEQSAGSSFATFATLLGPQTRSQLAGAYELTQRVDSSARGAFLLRMDVRVAQKTDLELFVCERHLLYDRDCQSAFIQVNPVMLSDKPVWQPLRVVFRGPKLKPSPWYAPRLKMFSMAVASVAGQADVHHLLLTGLGQTNLLSNGDFSQGLAHWFPAAQSYFEPWHLDNLLLEVLVERGVLGLAALLLLLAYALRLLVFGEARSHPLAPYLAASLLAVLLVGLVSSLMDVPRVAFLFFLLLFVALETAKAGSTSPVEGKKRLFSGDNAE
jgi:O-antigen ligase